MLGGGVAGSVKARSVEQEINCSIWSVLTAAPDIEKFYVFLDNLRIFMNRLI
jgi:hypothetical protein